MRASVLNLAAILLAAASAAGCATALPEQTATAEPPAKIRVAVLEKQAGIQAVSDWPQGVAAASVAGGALGAVGGVLVPYFWPLGGPLLTGPMVAMDAAGCARINRQFKEAAANFGEIARGVDLAGLRTAFIAAADGHAERHGQRLRGVSRAGGAELTLEILAVEFRLANGIRACARPEIQATVKWRASWTGTGQEIDARTSTVSDMRGDSQTHAVWLGELRRWLANPQSSRTELAAMLERAGSTVAGELFAVAN